MKIVFMGTPAFVAPVLESLITDSDFEIIGVYTQAPKAAGRGNKIALTPVHEAALQHNINVFTPHSLKKLPDEQNKLLQLRPDKIVVAAYGLILPAVIVNNIPCINIHPSALPKWRGAAPLQRAIIAGDKNLDICTMKMDAGMDTGDILLSRPFNLSGKEKFEELAYQVFTESISLLKETLLNYDSILPVPQSCEGTSHANKIEKSESLINWLEPASLIERKIRALNPLPGMYFDHLGERIKIISAKAELNDMDLSRPGTVINNNLSIACGNGILTPLELQRQGKKTVLARDFINGYKIPVGTNLIDNDL